MSRSIPACLVGEGDLVALEAGRPAVVVDHVEHRPELITVEWHAVDGGPDDVARGRIRLDPDQPVTIVLTAAQLAPPAVPPATRRRVQQIRKARA